jgi:transposase
VKIIDETPIKAGRKKKGKMKTGNFWPVLGGDNEIVFLFFESRERRHAFDVLGAKPEDGTVIVSDGYGAYKAYAEATGTLNAQCWSHSRRKLAPFGSFRWDERTGSFAGQRSSPNTSASFKA